jgi:hypothetical protein
MKFNTNTENLPLAFFVSIEEVIRTFFFFSFASFLLHVLSFTNKSLFQSKDQWRKEPQGKVLETYFKSLCEHSKWLRGKWQYGLEQNKHKLWVESICSQTVEQTSLPPPLSASCMVTETVQREILTHIK